MSKGEPFTLRCDKCSAVSPGLAVQWHCMPKVPVLTPTFVCAPFPVCLVSPCLYHQRQFKAKPVPAHVHESRMESMLAAHEAARVAAKVKAEMAKERVAKVLEEERAQR